MPRDQVIKSYWNNISGVFPFKALWLPWFLCVCSCSSHACVVALSFVLFGNKLISRGHSQYCVPLFLSRSINPQQRLNPVTSSSGSEVNPSHSNRTDSAKLHQPHPPPKGERSHTGDFSYVGIDAILEQMRRKAMKQGFELNIMVVGESDGRRLKHTTHVTPAVHSRTRGLYSGSIHGLVEAGVAH